MITKNDPLEQNKKLLDKIEKRQKTLIDMSVKFIQTNDHKPNENTTITDIINLLKFEQAEEKNDFVYLNKAL
jgi:hypothetical protein